MAIISPAQISDGTTIDAADVNNPINTIANEFNGNIDNNNIKTAAAIDGSKIADNSISASKLQNAAVGWIPLSGTVNTVTANGNRNYDLVFNSVDLTSTLSPGMKLQATRTVAAPTQCTDLESGSSQYYSKTTPAGMTFTDDFVCSAWIKIESYPASAMGIASRYNGTSGWAFNITSSGQVQLIGYNAASGNTSQVLSYGAVPLNKWVHVAAQLDMSTFTATTTTSYVMFDGVDISALVARSGTNPTALIQAGDFQIGAINATAATYFDGKLAQVAVYSAKVLQATIKASCNQTLSGSETSLISGYSFNGVITDLNTTNANNLTANGSAVATNADSPYAGGLTAGLLEYAYITSVTFSTNTTLSVVAPDSYLIPTTGGVSAVAYSTQATPYGWLSYNFNPYKFSVYRSTTQSINSFTKVLWNTEEYDTNNNFTGSTYTVPVTGFYAFTARVQITNAGGLQQGVLALLYKNGVSIKRGDETTASSTAGIPVTSNITAFVSLTAGDTIDLYCWTSGGLTLVAGAEFNYFMGYLISQT